MNSFYLVEELSKMGFKAIGENVLISRKASIYGANSMEIGNNVRIDDFCILSGNIYIGNYVHISSFCALYGKFGIEIGNYCGCSPRSTLFSAADDFSGEFMVSPMVPEKYVNLKKGTIRLKNYVQIGANSIVMPKITLNEGASTGAFCFVNKDLDPWSIYAGVPAKKLKDRKRGILVLAKELEEEIEKSGDE